MYIQVFFRVIAKKKSGVYEDMYVVIIRKMYASQRAKETDRHLATGTYLPIGNYHSVQQLVASSLSFYHRTSFNC